MGNISGHTVTPSLFICPLQTGGTHQVMQYQFIGWITSKLPDVPSFVQFVCEISRLIDENSYTNNAILVHDT